MTILKTIWKTNLKAGSILDPKAPFRSGTNNRSPDYRVRRARVIRVRKLPIVNESLCDYRMTVKPLMPSVDVECGCRASMSNVLLSILPSVDVENITVLLEGLESRPIIIANEPLRLSGRFRKFERKRDNYKLAITN